MTMKLSTKLAASFVTVTAAIALSACDTSGEAVAEQTPVAEQAPLAEHRTTAPVEQTSNTDEAIFIHVLEDGDVPIGTGGYLVSKDHAVSAAKEVICPELQDGMAPILLGGVLMDLGMEPGHAGTLVGASTVFCPDVDLDR